MDVDLARQEVQQRLLGHVKLVQLIKHGVEVYQDAVLVYLGLALDEDASAVLDLVSPRKSKAFEWKPFCLE